MHREGVLKMTEGEVFMRFVAMFVGLKMPVPEAASQAAQATEYVLEEYPGFFGVVVDEDLKSKGNGEPKNVEDSVEKGIDDMAEQVAKGFQS